MYETNMTIDRHILHWLGPSIHHLILFKNFKCQYTREIFRDVMRHFMYKAHDYMFPYHETQITTSMEMLRRKREGQEKNRTHIGWKSSARWWRDKDQWTNRKLAGIWERGARCTTATLRGDGRRMCAHRQTGTRRPPEKQKHLQQHFSIFWEKKINWLLLFCVCWEMIVNGIRKWN